MIAHNPSTKDGLGGSTIDFAHGHLGAASYFYELGTSFYQPCESFPDVINEAFPGFMVRVIRLSTAVSLFAPTPICTYFLTFKFLSSSMLPKLPRSRTSLPEGQIFSAPQSMQSGKVLEFLLMWEYKLAMMLERSTLMMVVASSRLVGRRLNLLKFSSIAIHTLGPTAAQ